MKVGDYVRTNDRGIRRIGKIIDDIFYKDEEDNLHQKGNLIKSSPNIIDLIEVGDYVNGYKVYEIKDNCVMVGYKCFKTPYDDSEEFLYQTIYKEDIKSIVTKKSMESVTYYVK